MRNSKGTKGSSLAVDLGPLSLTSPIITASGTYGYGVEFENLTELEYIGAITLKAVSLEPRAGNPYPRIVETPCGMLNSIGLENPGVEVFLDEKLPAAAGLGVPLIANLVGDKIDDYVMLAGMLDSREEIAALEINASCPNVEHGFTAFATDPGTLSELVSGVREVTKKTLIVKLSPNVTDILEIAEAAVNGGADILNIANTVLGMAIDIETCTSRLCRDYAGLSGRAIRPITLRFVHQVVSGIDLPVIGTGGIGNATDALEFLIAGASAVGTGTVNLIRPNQAEKIYTGIREYLERKDKTLAEIIGCYKSPDRGKMEY